MKLDNATETKVEGSEDFKSGQFSISDANSAHMFKMLTTYSDPIGAVVREITSNCFDAHTKAGIDRDVVISMSRGSELSGTDAHISFEDFGTGLTPKQVEEIFTVLGESTKRGGNQEIGAFGIGAKSPFGYIRDNDLGGFTVDTYVDGTHWQYFLAEDAEEGPMWTEMMEEETDRTNGTVVTIPISSGDYYDFKRAIRKELAYFDNIEFRIQGIPSEYTIYRGNTFVYRPDETPYDKIHACFGKVAYPLDYEQLEWNTGGYRSNRLRAPIGLYFDIGEIQVTPQREQINYTDKTIAKINERVEEAQEEFEEMWENQHDNITTIEELREARANSSNSEVTVQGVDIPYCEKLLENPKVNMDNFDLDIPKDIFYTMKVHKSVDSDGYVNSNARLPNVMTVLDNDRKTAFYVEDSYSPKTNRFIASRFGRDLKSNFYLVKKKSQGSVNSKYIVDDPAEDDWKPDDDSPLSGDTPPLDECDEPELHKARQRYSRNWTSYNDDKPSYDEVDKSTLREIIEFEKMVEKYTIDKLDDYDDIEVTEDFEKWEKKKREQKEKQKKKKRENEFPIKILDTDDGGWGSPEYKWSMDDMEYDALDNSTLYIYGFQDDDQDLLDIAPIIYSNEEFYKSQKYGADKLDRNRVAVLKIAMKREYLFEDLDNAMHISEFQDGHRIADRAYHASHLKNWFEKHGSSSAMKVLNKYYPELKERMKDIENFTSKYAGISTVDAEEKYGVEFSDNAEWGWRFEKDEVAMLNQAGAAIEDQLPLLEHMRIRRMDEEDWEEFEIYIRSKDLVHPKLWGNFKDEI